MCTPKNRSAYRFMDGEGKMFKYFSFMTDSARVITASQYSWDALHTLINEFEKSTDRVRYVCAYNYVGFVGPGLGNNQIKISFGSGDLNRLQATHCALSLAAEAMIKKTEEMQTSDEVPIASS